MVSSCERDSHFPPLSADLHKHIVLAGIFNGHVPDLDDLAPGAARRLSRLHILPELATRVRFLIRYAKLPTGVQK
jgi:hypothetical protein